MKPTTISFLMLACIMAGVYLAMKKGWQGLGYMIIGLTVGTFSEILFCSGYEAGAKDYDMGWIRIVNGKATPTVQHPLIQDLVTGKLS